MPERSKNSFWTPTLTKPTCCRRYQPIADIFDYQCSLFNGSGVLTQDGFNSLVSSMDIKCRSLRQRAVDEIFDTVNVDDGSGDDANPPGALVRYEFIAALVMLGLQRYHASGVCESESAAIQCFCEAHVAPEIVKKEQEAEEYDLPLYRNSFRAEHLYSKGVDRFFKTHLTDLKLLFMTFSSSTSKDPRYALSTRLSFVEWRSMMRDTWMEEVFKDVEGRCGLPRLVCFGFFSDFFVRCSGWSYAVLSPLSRFSCAVALLRMHAGGNTNAQPPPGPVLSVCADETFTEITMRICFNQSQMFVVNPVKTPKHMCVRQPQLS